MSTHDDDPDYEVGYRKPPKKTRFKKGQSGNPKGRPKDARGLIACLLQEMEKKISVREGNRVVEMSKMAALVKRLFERALKGDIAAIKIILALEVAITAGNPAENAVAIDAKPVDPAELDILRYYFSTLTQDSELTGKKGGRDDADT